ncbi:hypothetical protein [Stieleria varia]|uniref:Uncharacterized protein n=1 Tax=Stieleria varia TaxID=2528005 RepID=A0A5C6B6F4_9BACT|nr:hypothetical protein [Stieleria varia]TWU07653.1 hypothetical protein Pla52n_02260 [Stieleria varia]
MTSERKNASGWTKLALVVCVMAFVWLIVLPRLAKQDVVEARIRWLDEKRIDPAAMFYTELDSMDDYLSRIDH